MLFLMNIIYSLSYFLFLLYILYVSNSPNKHHWIRACVLPSARRYLTHPLYTFIFDDNIRITPTGKQKYYSLIITESGN